MSIPNPMEPSPSRRRRARWVVLAALGVLAATWAGWSVVAAAGSLRVYTIPPGSMAGAFHPGDRVCVDERSGKQPQRGEIWLFAMPASGRGLPGVAIKRVVGLPGETIEAKDGKLSVDGRPLDEPYPVGPMTYTLAPRTLGPADYFLLGDDRDASNDSHVWGPVPAERLVGRALYGVWPWKRAGGL